MTDNMEAKQPTNEQLKEFWEWCGFTNAGWFSMDNVPMYNYPDGGMSRLPELDLNNLFKYAVPKLMASDYSLRLTASKLVVDHSDSYNARITKFLNWGKDILIQDKDPAQALYKAIQEVIHGS